MAKNVCGLATRDKITQIRLFISHALRAARERHHYLKCFPRGWPVEEFLKSHLKNRHAYACKRGYLEDNTNQIQDKEEDKDPCDDAESHDESMSGRGSGKNDDLDRSEDNEWHRGAGWGSVGKDDDLDEMYASDSVDDMEVQFFIL